jgi:hypothetical protein
MSVQKNPIKPVQGGFFLVFLSGFFWVLLGGFFIANPALLGSSPI